MISFYNQFSSVTQSCPTLCDPMNRSTPGLPVHHHLREFTQTHVHQVSDAIQPSHPSVVPFSSCSQSLPASESFPMSQLFALVITFLPRSKCLLILWLQSPSAVILEPRKIKSATVSTVFLSICYEVTGLDAMILVFWMLSLSQFFHSPLSLSSRDS